MVCVVSLNRGVPVTDLNDHVSGAWCGQLLIRYHSSVINDRFCKLA